MESNSPAPSIPPETPIGHLSNGGVQRYLLEAESSTGFVAWKMADGTTLISDAMQVSLAACASISFWACAGYQDTTPAGDIISFDCHGNSLTHLDIRGLTGLEYLDCSFNKLERLMVTGLGELEAIDADNNNLVMLLLGDLPNLRVLNCAHNRLSSLDIGGLDSLEILDVSYNRLTQLTVPPAAPLRDVQTGHNPLSLRTWPGEKP